MKIIAFLISLIGIAAQSDAQQVADPMPHEMQHGFVLAADDTFASHLVATGHHSRQVDIMGQLSIEDQQELATYEERKSLNADGGSYFLFQAQSLDLPSLKAGQILTGHIIESNVGNYEPTNVIVTKATFRIERVLLNMENPFFKDE
jgi:hypothetical protein